MELSELDCGDDCRDSQTASSTNFGGTGGVAASTGTIAEEDGLPLRQSSAQSGASAAVGEATISPGGHAPVAQLLSISSGAGVLQPGPFGTANSPQLLHEDLVGVLLDLAREWRSRPLALAFHSPANDAITLELAILNALLSPRGTPSECIARTHHTHTHTHGTPEHNLKYIYLIIRFIRELSVR